MFQDAVMRKVGVLVGVAAIVALLAYTYFAIVQARNLAQMPVSITIDGKGEVFARPDIATFSFSVTAKENDATTAQSTSAERMNAIVSYLKGAGIEEKDIKTTGYNLYPRYEYPDTRCNEFGCPPVGEPTLIGYEVSQTVTVKVRNTGDAGKLISGVGELGATNVSGLSFTIDDEDSLKEEARTAAIADAKMKAEKLADELGVKLVRMTGYWEDQGNPYYGYGMGGDAMYSAKAESMDAMISPEIPTGEQTITSNVHITYEIR